MRVGTIYSGRRRDGTFNSGSRRATTIPWDEESLLILYGEVVLSTVRYHGMRRVYLYSMERRYSQQ